MTDDQGYPEISAHGNPVLQTPNLDRLHGQSIRLSDYHASPMCTPTRGQLLTGLDAARNGAVNVSSGRALLRPENPTMANYFADAGYSTGVLGNGTLGLTILTARRIVAFRKASGIPPPPSLRFPPTGGTITSTTPMFTTGRKNSSRAIALRRFLQRGQAFHFGIGPKEKTFPLLCRDQHSPRALLAEG